jgi:hypothetical protein
VQENSDRANEPMLPVVGDDDCGAIYLLLMALYESSMIFEGTIFSQPSNPEASISCRTGLS